MTYKFRGWGSKISSEPGMTTEDKLFITLPIRWIFNFHKKDNYNIKILEYVFVFKKYKLIYIYVYLNKVFIYFLNKVFIYIF